MQKMLLFLSCEIFQNCFKKISRALQRFTLFLYLISFRLSRLELVLRLLKVLPGVDFEKVRQKNFIVHKVFHSCIYSVFVCVFYVQYFVSIINLGHVHCRLLLSFFFTFCYNIENPSSSSCSSFFPSWCSSWQISTPFHIFWFFFILFSIFNYFLFICHVGTLNFHPNISLFFHSLKLLMLLCQPMYPGSRNLCYWRKIYNYINNK